MLLLRIDWKCPRSGIHSRVSSVAAANATWTAISRREGACVFTTCPTWRTWSGAKSAATALWRMEKSVIVENLRSVNVVDSVDLASYHGSHFKDCWFLVSDWWWVEVFKPVGVCHWDVKGHPGYSFPWQPHTYSPCTYASLTWHHQPWWYHT